MTNQSADDAARDPSTAPVGMRELPSQPAMPSFPTAATVAPEPSNDEDRPGPHDSVIARDDHFEGTFTSRGTVRVEGSVDGRIEAARIRIQEGALVKADVVVDEAIVAGAFDGSLTCRQRLEARPTGRIDGRVETHKLMLHEGASVEGEVHMLPDPATASGETIRGSAPVRGEGAPGARGVDTRADVPRQSVQPAAGAPSTATRTEGTPGEDPSTPAVDRTSSTRAAGRSADAADLRVTPRATLPVDPGGNGRITNGATSDPSSGTSRF